MAEEKQLDVEQFRAFVAHFDNANVNERGNAIRQAKRACEAAGLTFPEACALAFGQDGGGDDRIEKLETRIDELETENRRILAMRLDELGELEGRGEGEKKRRRGEGFRGLLADAWSYAQFRLLLVWCLIVARMGCFVAVESSGAQVSGKVTWWLNRVFVALLVWLFIKWSGAQYEQSGVGPVFMRWILFGGLSVAALFWFFDGAGWAEWFRHGAHVKAVGAFGVLLVAVVLGTCNFTERVSGKAASSGFLRSWFL